MQHIVLILLFLALGVLLRTLKRMPPETTKVLGAFVINVSLPATALHAVHRISIDEAFVAAAATPWIGALIAILLLVPLGRALGWSRQRVGGLILVAGWGNTSFVGLPMIAAFASTKWLGLGLVIDLFGSYLALSTLGILVASIASGAAVSPAAILRRVVTFPPFLAILLALATNDLARPEWLDAAIASLAATMTPLALVAVGFALRLDTLAGRTVALGVALSYRLLVAPALILALCLLLPEAFAGEAEVRRIAVLEMAMPPMLGATIIALEYDLDPDLVALVIGIGIPLSMLTASLWWMAIG